MNKDQYFRRKSQLQKVASVPQTTEKQADIREMQEAFIRNAEKAVLSEVTAKMYSDPLLGPIMESGDVKTASRLAVGRYADQETLDKLASLEHTEIEKLAEAGLKNQLQQKVAELDQRPEPGLYLPFLRTRSTK